MDEAEQEGWADEQGGRGRAGRQGVGDGTLVAEDALGLVMALETRVGDILVLSESEGWEEKVVGEGLFVVGGGEDLHHDLLERSVSKEGIKGGVYLDDEEGYLGVISRQYVQTA